MFNNKEVQVLISGAEIPVDIEDLMIHTNYTGDIFLLVLIKPISALLHRPPFNLKVLCA